MFRTTACRGQPGDRGADGAATLQRARIIARTRATGLAPMEALLADLARYGVPLVGLNVFLQQLGLPIPAVPTMMVAGALAVDGRIFGAGVFGISVLASVVADALWFLAGRRYGYPVLRLLCRVSLSPDTCVRQTEGIFERYGFYSLVVSKFVPGFSTVAPPVAGALRMSFGQFLLAAIASAALWVGAAMSVGLLFATQIEAVLAWIGRNGVLAAIVLFGLLALYIAWKAVAALAARAIRRRHEDRAGRACARAVARRAAAGRRHRLAARAANRGRICPARC